MQNQQWSNDIFCFIICELVRRANGEENTYRIYLDIGKETVPLHLFCFWLKSTGFQIAYKWPDAEWQHETNVDDTGVSLYGATCHGRRQTPRRLRILLSHASRSYFHMLSWCTKWSPPEQNKMIMKQLVASNIGVHTGLICIRELPLAVSVLGTSLRVVLHFRRCQVWSITKPLSSPLLTRSNHVHVVPLWVNQRIVWAN